RGANFFQQFGFGYNRMRDAFNGDDVWGPYNIAGLLRQAAGPLPRIYLVSLLDPNNLPNPATLAPDERIATYSTSLYGFPSLNVTERTTANYQGTLTNAGGALVFGYDYDHQSATIEGPSATRDNNGFFAQKQQRIGERLFLSGGFRVEHSSAYGTEFTPRGAASFLLFHEHGPLSSTFFRLSAGHGVTEPSIYDTYVQSPYYHGNPGLKPERTNSYEAGLVQEWFGRRVHTEVNLFRNSFDNLIAFTTDTWQNVESSWARGVEVSGQAKPISGLLLSGGYTRLYSRITNSVTPADPVFGIGQELLRRPRNSGFVSVQVSPKRCSLIAGARFVGERQDADFVFGINRNPSYQNVYASASCQVAKHFTPVVSGENLLNQRYEEVLGFTSLSRTVMGGIRIGW
ncbi:MAG: TonB-dependent receptor plug domain-containing protein, partial [Bryobacteraceae bacterium]